MFSALQDVAVVVVLFGDLLLAVPLWLACTHRRRKRLRALLRARSWPRVALTPGLLLYPDAAFRKLPPYEQIAAAPLDRSTPASRLKSTLHLLAPPGAQWMRW